MSGRNIFIVVLVLTLACAAQKTGKNHAPEKQVPSAAAEDITGVYSFLKEGEFVQIILDQNRMSGYVSREGELESDRGEFLDQFFSKAEIRGHNLSFTTKPVHGVWFEFQGNFERGPARSKAEDGYYLLRGTLTQFVSDAQNKPAAHSREVEFRWLAQPDEDTGNPRHAGTGRRHRL
jgi:hypothetical protein